MKKYVILHKKVGETPLALLETFRAKNSWVGNVKLAYAGRLDPMAYGKLLVLIGPECKKQTNYLKLDKEYIFEVLLNVSSDTGDVLGIAHHKDAPPIGEKALRDITQTFTGNVSMPFPHYSSKTVQGKPLFLWTLERRLGEITIPIKNSEIYKLSFKGLRTIPAQQVEKEIFNKINSIPKVTAPSKALGRDFRRKEIRTQWNEIFDTVPQTEFQVATFSCIASSGTYMRSLADEIGKALGTTGLAYSIHRTKIGRYKKLYKSLGIWYKNFT